MTTAPVPKRQFTILHVDDFEEFLDEFRAIFAEEFDITSALSGAEGLALLEQRDFEAVIVDYDMPDMDGLAFMEMVKERWPLLPVFFCTGQGSEQVARRALTAGAADYFVKDFSFFVDRDKLVNSVRRAVDNRAVEEALQKERRMVENLIEFNPYSIHIYDRDGFSLRVNRAHLNLFHSNPMPGYNGFRDPNLLQAGYGPLIERMKQGETITCPIIPYNPSWLGPQYPDHQVYIAAVGFPLLDTRGELEGAVVMHEDVTARVAAEDALKEAHAALQESHALLERRVEERTAELAEANRALQQQAEKRERLQMELVRKNRELEEFSSRVSHDLRNELLVLKKTLELASGDHPETQQRSQALLARYDHLIQFVERLLSLARAGTTISSRVEMPAEPLLRGLFERLRPPQVAAELHVQAKAPPIPGDPLRLEQVFANLLSNTFQYRDAAREPVRIEVEIHLDGAETEVVYRDNGMGILPEHLDRVFDMSFTTDRHHQFGLGLSFAKKIVEAHGGQIRAASQGRGHGAVFTLRLPVPASKRKQAAASRPVA